MNRRLVKKILLTVLTMILIVFIYKKLSMDKEVIINGDTNSKDIDTNSSVIKDVSYVSKDASGNEYILFASEGQIDMSDNKKIFLTNVEAMINLNDNSKVQIKSDFGKYNIDNFDTIFSKNVIITYMNSEIKGNYLDFSLERNSLIISKNVVFNNLNNMLKADVVEIDIKTKDTKIYMYENEKKVNIKSID